MDEATCDGLGEAGGRAPDLMALQSLVPQRSAKPVLVLPQAEQAHLANRASTAGSGSAGMGRWGSASSAKSLALLGAGRGIFLAGNRRFIFLQSSKALSWSEGGREPELGAALESVP